MRRARRRWRVPLAILGLLAAAFFYVVYRQVLTITQKPSWPPTASAITAAGAQAATERFAARSDPKPADVGMPYAWSTAATIDPWPEGKNFFPRIFADIEQAHSSVHILMFGWREGEIGTKLADLLIEKMKQGVEVRIIVDGQGSQVFGPAGPMFTRLADAGAQIVVNDLLPWDKDGLYPDHRQFDWTQDDVGHADHRKLYVIDGTVVWIGGAGIEDHFANGKFHDVMVRVTGNVVRQAQALFLMSFRGHGGPLPTDLSKYFPVQPVAGTVPVALLQVAPGGFQSATQAIRELIDHAKTRLDIMNPYFTDADIIQRVIAAAKRGVKVRIVVSEKSNNTQATAALQAPLQRAHRRRRADLGIPRRRRPCEAGRRRRHRGVRHRELRRLGSLPELRGRDDGSQPRRRDALRGTRLRPRYRALPPRQAADRNRRADRRLGLGPPRLLPLAGFVLLARRRADAPNRGPDRAAASTTDAATREPEPPAGSPADDSVVVHGVLHGRGDHHRRAAEHRDDPEPGAAGERSDPGQRDQPEDDHEPPVV